MIKSIKKSTVPPYLLIVGLIILAYANTFNVPFIFDDRINILDNSTIRSVWPPWSAFYAMPGTGLAGRPVVNFTLALNYAISAEKVWSYHVLNLIIHIMAALTLFGIVRRLLRSVRFNEKYGHFATSLALGCALLWGLHPIQTQAVTYVSQRFESLMGLFFFLTFYCAIRGWQSSSVGVWHSCAIIAFLLGVGSKEVIVVAPFVLLVCDMIFFHFTIKEVIRRSWFLYTGLSIGLAFLGLLVAMGGILATGTTKVSFTPAQYWLTQAQVILHYVRLTLWPDSLCLDYDWPIAGIRNALPSVIILFMVLAVSVWLCFKRHPAGFLAAWFFAILAPTSCVPLIDPAWDYRMYLPSVALVILVTGGIYQLGNLASAHCSADADFWQHLSKKIFGYTMMFLVLLMGILTYSRNLDYQTDISIWADTVGKRPQNARAHKNLGVALMEAGKLCEAIGHLRQGINLKSQNIDPALIKATLVNPYKNLGVVYLRLGNWRTAENYFRNVLVLEPNDAVAHSHLGFALYMQGQSGKAFFHLQKALFLRPQDVDARVNYGIVLRLQGNCREAMGHFQEALRIRPDNVNAMNGMGMALYQLGRRNEAKDYFQKVLAVMPDNKTAGVMLTKIDEEQKQSKR